MREEIRKILGLPIKEPIEYWVKYWKHFIGALLDESNYDVVLDSPRFLIDNIISEIEYNDFRNKENREFFKNQLSIWNMQDVVFSKLFNGKVKLLLNRWNSESTRYLLSICKQISADLDKGTYFDALLEHLIDIIESTSSLDYAHKKDINKYTELIVAEFIASGFVAEDIKSLANDIKNIIRAEGGDILCAPDTYKGLNKDYYANNDLYYEAIEKVIANRTIAERVSVLKDTYYIEPKDCYVLIRLEGIKGNIDCKIGDVDIYTPHKKKYITEISTLSKIEQVAPERNFTNAAIPVKHKMPHSSIAYAIQQLETVIDLLALTYNNSAPIKYSYNNISIVENGGFIYGTNLSHGNDDAQSKHQEFTRYMGCLDLSNRDKELKTVGMRFSAINDNQTQNAVKLKIAAHWFQKGKYAQLPEDKLLFHWIAIESLLKTDDTVRFNIAGKDGYLIHTIQKIAIAILLKRYFRDYCISTYLYINRLTQNGDNYFDISHEIIDKASLNMKTGDKVDVSKFLNNIAEIESGINDEILKTELRELSIFYEDGKCIKNKELEIKNDILLIYRLRNLISHNAVYPRYLIGFYANKVQKISGEVIRYLIEKYRTSDIGIDDILIDTISDYDEFVLNIDTELLKLKS